MRSEESVRLVKGMHVKGKMKRRRLKKKWGNVIESDNIKVTSVSEENMGDQVRVEVENFDLKSCERR